MCRAGGRRCDRKWDDAHRERYNARRRIVRNSQKAEAARSAGDEAKAGYYEDLTGSAQDSAEYYDQMIHDHEQASQEEAEQSFDYRLGHTAPEDDGYSNPITRLTDGFFGDDVYEHPDWYGVADDETMEQLTAVRDDPDVTVRIYRAVPHDHQEINNGDWITLSREYAEEHSFDMDGPGNDGVVVSTEVPATQVFTDGNDLAEYGYTGPNTALGSAPNALEEVRETSRNWRASWSSEEDEAFDTYGAIDHADINAKLRAGQSLTSDETHTVTTMDAALDRAPRTDKTHTLYRGIGFSDDRDGTNATQWVNQHCQPGQDVSFDSFTSTSTDPGTAEYFSGANSEHTTSGVIFEVDTSQAGYTGDSPENEVLLQRGSHFTVSSTEPTTVNGKSFQRVRLTESHAPTPSPVATDHALASRPSASMQMSFIRNPVSSTQHVAGNDFGQDVEPSGRYLTESAGVVPDGWESGTVTFSNPLHMNWGDSGSYDDDDNWKRRLSAHYGGQTGPSLSQAVRADGYDAIVTHDKYGTSEIVDLTSLSPRPGPGASAAPSSPKWDRRKKYTPRDSRDLGKHLAAKHGVTMDLKGSSSKDSYVTLSKIEVPKEQRGKGVGKKVMREFLNEADRNGWKVALTPSGDFGGNVTRLKRFYRDLGFVPNKGRNKDFTTQEGFLRPPQ